MPGRVLGGGGTEMPAPGPGGRSPLSVAEKNSCHSVCGEAGGDIPEPSLRRICSGHFRVCLSIREGFTEEVVLGLRLAGWVGVYQISKEERASRPMALLWS